jgi:hypothetical protein
VWGSLLLWLIAEVLSIFLGSKGKLTSLLKSFLFSTIKKVDFFQGPFLISIKAVVQF